MKAEDIIRKRVTAYRRVFESPDGEAVLTDLRNQFDKTTLKKVDGVIDPHASLAAAGCREVVLYIEQMMNINIKEDKNDAVD